jgi:hypothetical protein
MSSKAYTVWESPLSDEFVRALYRVSAVNPDNTGECRSELDSHADTCVGGSNTALLGPAQTVARVSAFAPGYGSKDYPVGTIGTVWTDPLSGIDYLLVIHQAIFLGKELKHSLLNPNQMRANGLNVDDCPKQYDPKSTHSIVVEDPQVTIPLSLHGIVSYFPSRKPTQEDVESLEWITLTGTARWKPKSKEFAEKEALMVAATEAVETLEMEEIEARCIGAAEEMKLQPTELQDDLYS